MINIKQKFNDVLDRALPFGVLVREMPYILVFKTTNWCWYKCAHCCESSGPDQARVYIPAPVIKNYIAQASWDPYFARSVVFTGGEIFSSYKWGDPTYVPTLLRICTENNIGADIKTNAGWARTSFGEQIFRDLTDVVKSARPYSLQMSMSLDNYHTNAVINVSHVISRLAREKCPVMINLSSFGGMEHLYDELKSQIKKSGLTICPGHFGSLQNMMSVDTVGEKLVMHFGGPSAPFANGRARDLPNAVPTEFPQFKVFLPGMKMLVAFDVFGRVTLGENSGQKISTEFIGKDNTARPLADIRRDLVRNARAAELRAILFQGYKPIPVKSNGR